MRYGHRTVVARAADPSRVVPLVESRVETWPVSRSPEDLRAAAATGPIVPREPAATPQIDTRAAALKARAARLRGDVIDATSKERLEQDIKLEEEEI